MRRQAIGVYSARGACRVDAVNLPVFTAECSAGKLRVGPFYLRTADKITCVCRQFCTRQFYSVVKNDNTTTSIWDVIYADDIAKFERKWENFAERTGALDQVITKFVGKITHKVRWKDYFGEDEVDKKTFFKRNKASKFFRSWIRSVRVH